MLGGVVLVVAYPGITLAQADNLSARRSGTGNGFDADTVIDR
jgi:hypothetical protein